MNPEVDCIILWHYFTAEGKLINSSSTRLMGSMQDLNDRIRDAHDATERNQGLGRGYCIAAQIIAKGA